MKDLKNMTPADYEALVAQLAELDALKSENALLKNEQTTGVKAVTGTFKATLKEEGKPVEKTFGFALGSPVFFRTLKGNVVHAESMMKIAKGETVTAESIKSLVDAALAAEQTLVAFKFAKFSDELPEYTQATAKAELQRLAEIGYGYLEESKPAAKA